MRILAVFLVGIWMTAAPASAAERTISVNGSGTVDAAPDMAVITMGVSHQAPQARKAMDLVAEATSAILSRLESEGIAERDMQTSNLSLHPVWNRPSDRSKPARVVGFTASSLLTVRVRDLDALGGILDMVIDDGANSFSGLQFTLQDPEPVQDAARVAAVRDARRKAMLYAEAAGVTLGAVMSISEAGGSRPEPVMMARAAYAEDSGVPVAPGEVSTRASVSVVFAIAD